jgi:hypothetical protein
VNHEDWLRIIARDRFMDPQWAAEDRHALISEVRELRKALVTVLDRHDVGYVLNCKACATARNALPRVEAE